MPSTECVTAQQPDALRDMCAELLAPVSGVVKHNTKEAALLLQDALIRDLRRMMA